MKLKPDFYPADVVTDTINWLDNYDETVGRDVLRVLRMYGYRV